MSILPTTPLERIRQDLVELKMVRTLEALDACVRHPEEDRHTLTTGSVSGKRLIRDTYRIPKPFEAVDSPIQRVE